MRKKNYNSEKLCIPFNISTVNLLLQVCLVKNSHVNPYNLDNHFRNWPCIRKVSMATWWGSKEYIVFVVFREQQSFRYAIFARFQWCSLLIHINNNIILIFLKKLAKPVISVRKPSLEFLNKIKWCTQDFIWNSL